MVKLSFNILFYFFFISYKLFSNCNDNCDSFKNCFNCILCGDNTLIPCHCLWLINKCLSFDNDDSNRWYNKILICSQPNSTSNIDSNITNNYCPSSSSKKTEKDLDDDSITFALKPDSNGFYGQNNILCDFEYEQSSAKDIIINVEFSNSINIYPYVYIENTNHKSLVSRMYVESNRKIEFSKSKKVNIKVLIKTKYTTSPITIILSLKYKRSSIIISIIVTLSFIGIVSIFIVYCCYKRRKINEERRLLRIRLYNQARQNMARIEQENNNDLQINNANIEQINKEILDKLFKGQMAQHLYKKEYNEYGGGCSICLEEFNKNSKVSITSCKHVFHYDCIYDWLHKIIKNPKCPNCNHEILNDVDENNTNYSNKENDTNIIKVKKKTGLNDIKSNNFNLNSNLERREVNINNGNNIGNIEASQSQRPF